MTNLRTAAQQALEALEWLKQRGLFGDFHGVAEALRAALAEPNRAQKLTEAGYTRRPTLRELAEGAEPFSPEEIRTTQAAWKMGYEARKAEEQEPVQEPVGVVTSMVLGGVTWHRWPSDMPDGTKLYTAPPQRKPPATIDEMFARMDKAPRGVFSGHDPMTIWMEAWRAAEQHHGIKCNPASPTSVTFWGTADR